MRKNSQNREIIGVYTRYKICGRNVHVLLNKLKNNNVYVKNVKRVNEKTTLLSIKYSDNEKFFAITNEMWYNVKIKDYGLLYPLLFLGKNVGVLIGVAILLFVSIFSNDYIFDISFSGTGSVYERELVANLNEKGISRFSRFSNVDLKQVANKLLIENDKINYISLEKQGNILKVNAVKKVESLTEKKASKTTFISNVDGTLENLIVYRGTAVKTAGERIKKGDILAQGYANIKDQIVDVYVLATASIIVEYDYTYTSKNDKEETLALILAKEYLHKETASESVKKIKNNDEFIYTVCLKYRVIISV